MNIDELTLGEIKKLKSLFACESEKDICENMIGKQVIIRTYSAGVHYGTLAEKHGNEVILKNARRLWYWKTTNGGISLSEIANDGVHSTSKLTEPVASIWMEAIEIIPCTQNAINSIESQHVHRV